MKPLDQLLTDIAREHLNIETLIPRMSDALDFYNVAVWQVEAALKAAFDACVLSTDKNAEGSMTNPSYSPAPWSYEYNPYTVGSKHAPLGVGEEIPAFEVFDAQCDKIFDTNEDSPCELQEANARLAAAAPRLLASLVTCANLLADFDESDGPEGEACREAVAAIAEATGTPG